MWIGDSDGRVLAAPSTVPPTRLSESARGPTFVSAKRPQSRPSWAPGPGANLSRQPVPLIRDLFHRVAHPSHPSEPADGPGRGRQRDLDATCDVTGGVALRPASMADLVAAFERDAFISPSARAPYPGRRARPPVAGPADMERVRDEIRRGCCPAVMNLPSVRSALPAGPAAARPIAAAMHAAKGLAAAGADPTAAIALPAPPAPAPAPPAPQQRGGQRGPPPSARPPAAAGGALGKGRLNRIMQVGRNGVYPCSFTSLLLAHSLHPPFHPPTLRPSLYSQHGSDLASLYALYKDLCMHGWMDARMHG